MKGGLPPFIISPPLRLWFLHLSCIHRGEGAGGEVEIIFKEIFFPFPLEASTQLSSSLLEYLMPIGYL